MGNVHSVIQIAPRYFEGAAIEIPPEHWSRMSRLYAAREHDEPNVLIKEFETDYRVFCDGGFEEIRRFLVVQDGGKRGYEFELPELLTSFAPCLEDADFYVDDEYAGYVERFRITSGSLEVERVVETGGDAFSYLDGALAELPELHTRLLLGRARSLQCLASSWLRNGRGAAAEDDRREALALLERAAELSGDWRIRYEQGYLLNQLGEHERAAEALALAMTGVGDDDVIDQRAHRQAILVSQGYSASKLGVHDKAHQLYQQAAGLRSMTTRQQARINESVTLIKLGRLEEARAACQEVLDRGDSRYELASSFYNLACALAPGDEKAEALRALWAAITLRPSCRDDAREDEDFAWLQDDPGFQELFGADRDSSADDPDSVGG